MTGWTTGRSTRTRCRRRRAVSGSWLARHKVVSIGVVAALAISVVTAASGAWSDVSSQGADRVGVGAVSPSAPTLGTMSAKPASPRHRTDEAVSDLDPAGTAAGRHRARGAGAAAGQGPGADDRLHPRAVRPGVVRRRPQRLRHPQRHAAPRPRRRRQGGHHGCLVLRGTLRRPLHRASHRVRARAGTSPTCRSTTSSRSSDAWQKGAQQLARRARRHSPTTRSTCWPSTGPPTSSKGDGDAATWLPPRKQTPAVRGCARSRSAPYGLWVTAAERDAMARVLATRPGTRLPASGKPVVTSRPRPDRRSRPRSARRLVRELHRRPRRRQGPDPARRARLRPPPGPRRRRHRLRVVPPTGTAQPTATRRHVSTHPTRSSPAETRTTRGDRRAGPRHASVRGHDRATAGAAG